MATFGIGFLGKFFGSVTGVDVDESELKVHYKSNETSSISYGEIVDFPKIHSGLFGTTLTVETASKKHVFRFLRKPKENDTVVGLMKGVSKHILAYAQIVITTFNKNCTEHFLRDSAIESLDESCQLLLKRYKNSSERWEEYFDETLITALKGIDESLPIDKHKEQLRQSYLETQLRRRSRFFDQIESNPLTEQQRVAVLHDNDRNLVLAAAGTGKTSVMVAKSLNLINTLQARPDELLVLAFNRAASKELQERIKVRGELVGVTEEHLPRVATFHKLGREILRGAGITTYLSDFSEDDKKLKIWITEWLIDYIQTDPKRFREFLNLRYQPVNASERVKGSWTDFDFNLESIWLVFQAG